MLRLSTHAPGCPDAAEWRSPKLALWSSRFDDNLIVSKMTEIFGGYGHYSLTGPGGRYLEFGRTFGDDATAFRRSSMHLQRSYAYVWNRDATRGHDLVAGTCPSCFEVSLIADPETLTDRVRDYLGEALGANCVGVVEIEIENEDGTE